MILLLLLGLNSWGQTPPTVHVQQLDPMVNVDRMGRPGVQVHKLKPSEKRKTPELLTPEFQNKLLIESHLDSETAMWDSFGRDVFFIHVKNLSVEQCASKYKSLPVEKLAHLKRLIIERSAKK